MKLKLLVILAFALMGATAFITACDKKSEPTKPSANPTPTFTITVTSTPAPVDYEDWDRANYPAFGDPWGILATPSAICPGTLAATGTSFMADPYFNGNTSSTSICIDNSTTHGSSAYSLKVTGTYDASGTGLMELAFRSGYANGVNGNYGWPINVGSTAPGSLNFWLYADHALVIKPFVQTTASMTSTTVTGTSFYGTTTNVTTTGSWVKYTFPAANWDGSYAGLTWGSVLHVGIDISPDGSTSFTTSVNVDDIYFNP